MEGLLLDRIKGSHLIVTRNNLSDFNHIAFLLALFTLVTIVTLILLKAFNPCLKASPYLRTFALAIPSMESTLAQVMQSLLFTPVKFVQM